MTEGTSQIDIMMEYTLFGDPALQIAIANGEIQPIVETKQSRRVIRSESRQGIFKRLLTMRQPAQNALRQTLLLMGHSPLKPCSPGKQRLPKVLRAPSDTTLETWF